MPSAIEIPETIEQEQAQQSHETLPPMLAPRRGVISIIITTISAVAKHFKQHRDRQVLRHEEVEMPLDTLAREHPYIKTLAG